MHFAQYGRVGCPYRGDVDIDLCYGCDKLIDIQDQGDVTVVTCRTQRMFDEFDVRLLPPG